MAELPLRERKYAATKASLMNALISRLSRQTLDQIAVKDVCNDVQVSETTFFNYFPSKQAAIGYRIQLWSVGTIWEMQQQLARCGTHVDAVRQIFNSAGQAEEQTPGVMREVVIFQATSKMEFSSLTPAEYAYHFPNSAGIAHIKAAGVQQMIGGQLEAAQRAGELSPTLDLSAFAVILMGIFFLTPVLLASGQYGSVRDAYRRQLDILFSN